VVIELGENAHMERRDKPDADIQETHVASAVRALVPLARRHQLILTHGNGPQVAVLARIRLTIRACPSQPVRSPGRQTQGMIGYYWLLQALVAGRGAEIR
jgi:carbamate kinase